MKSYSQYEQDLILYNEIFKNRENSEIFIDIGAYDGIKYSNTYFFEKLGWSGICIEPLPGAFHQMKQNRKCILENCAISDAEGEFDFTEIIGNENDDMVSGFNREEIAELLNLNHPTSYKKIKVPTFRLDTILHKYKIKNVDFCSIDVEGHGLNVVKSIDWDLFNISYLCIEANDEIEEVKKFISPLYKDYLNVYANKKGKIIGDIIFKRI